MTVTTSLRKTAATLSDGRQIIYFDHSEAALGMIRKAQDTRPVIDRATSGTMRFDRLTGEWVAIAGHRQNRTFMPPADECPLCPSGQGTVPSEIPEADYDVVVFENRFPSFSAVAGQPDRMDAFFEQRPAAGRCEVVCFTAEHATPFSSLSVARVRTVIEAWIDRTVALSDLPDVESVFCFENRGEEIGVTLHHPHGQIYAYPYVPPRTRQVLTQAKAHFDATGRLLGTDILAQELADGSRIVLDGQHWTAYVPYAARWPVEVHLAPKRDVPDLPALTAAEADELASMYLELLRKLDGYYVSEDGAPVELPYIAGWHQAPVREGRHVSRLYLQVLSVLRAPGRLKYLAGSESGVGAWVNDVQPERIAARLREV